MGKKSFRYFLITWLTILGANCSAQEVLHLSRGMINSNGELPLDDFNEWVFKSGNDTTWSAKEIDTSGWKKTRFPDLSVDDTDQNGRLEGWFRIRIKLDSTFRNTPLFIYKRSLDAADVFVDGKLIVSYGKIAPSRELYKASVDNGMVPFPLDLELNRPHTIAIHILDYTTTFPHYLVSQYSGKGPFLGIASKQYFDQRTQYWEQDPVYKAIWLSIGGVLCLVFWILTFLSSGEKSIRYIAMGSTLSLLMAIGMTLFDLKGLDFPSWRIFLFIFLTALLANLIFIPLVVSQIFLNQVSRKLQYSSLTIFLLGILSIISLAMMEFILVAAVFCFSVSIYFVIKHWKSLRGAQWAFVVGILIMAFCLMLLLLTAYLGMNGIVPVSVFTLNVITTVIFLSLPIAMLVYVLIRFREINDEVQQKAQRIIQIAEEKRELLATQNEVLEKQVQERTSELNNSLQNLKATQAQLIQSEKMASLGELTAGIAHEIQNPLNFVNNYSEVNVELISELSEEFENGNSAEVKAIIQDLADNETKIHHHGQRADSIVRSMMQHSRTNSGTREPTDLNALADEYLRLAYQSFLAKEPELEIELNTDFDEQVPLVEVVPQDIGRVLLNIINNAFQATEERRKSQAQPDYSPKVKITTKNKQGSVEICILDNGWGIPASIKDKIFQPFFTTKPTGSGTGLGLSLAYDIVKAHGGELTVNTIVGECTEFCIELPIHKTRV